MATILPGVRPSISFASRPTASVRPVTLLMATIGRLVQHDALAPRVDARVGGPEIYGEIAGKQREQRADTQKGPSSGCKRRRRRPDAGASVVVSAGDTNIRMPGEYAPGLRRTVTAISPRDPRLRPPCRAKQAGPADGMNGRMLDGTGQAPPPGAGAAEGVPKGSWRSREGTWRRRLGPTNRMDTKDGTEAVPERCRRGLRSRSTIRGTSDAVASLLQGNMDSSGIGNTP